MKWKGSLLVEAGYVLPFTFISMVLILLLAFYQYDVLIFRSSLRFDLMQRVSENIEEDYVIGTLPIYFLSYTDLQYEKKKEKEKISGNINFEIFPAFVTFDSSVVENIVTEEYQRYQPQDKARKMGLLFGNGGG